MASDQKNVDYITEQMQAAGEIRSRKMFGEYAIYCDEKVIALVCNDKLYLKVTNEGETIVKDKILEPPYNGSKPHFVIDDSFWNDNEYLSRLANVTAKALPKKKK